MQKFIKNCLTSQDNETYEIGRVLWFMGTIIYFIISIVSVIKNQPWQPIDFGSGFGILMAGSGMSVAVKSKSEPEEKKDDE